MEELVSLLLKLKLDLHRNEQYTRELIDLVNDFSMKIGEENSNHNVEKIENSGTFLFDGMKEKTKMDCGYINDEVLIDLIDIFKNNMLDCSDPLQIHQFFKELKYYYLSYPEISEFGEEDIYEILRRMEEEEYIRAIHWKDRTTFGIEILTKSNRIIDHLSQYEKKMQLEGGIVNLDQFKPRLALVRTHIPNIIASTLDAKYPGYVVIYTLFSNELPKKRFGIRLRVHYYDNYEEFNR